MKGRIRINSRRVVKSHYSLKEGDILTLAQGKKIRVIRIVTMPDRRGPASEAQECYKDVVYDDATQEPEGRISAIQCSD